MNSWVYFIAELPNGPMKIGLSVRPYRRLAQLQTGHPARLKLLAVIPGNHAMERQIHRRFASQRLSGEWFRIDDLLLNFIQDSGRAPYNAQPAWEEMEGRPWLTMPWNELSARQAWLGMKKANIELEMAIIQEGFQLKDTYPESTNYLEAWRMSERNGGTA